MNIRDRQGDIVSQGSDVTNLWRINGSPETGMTKHSCTYADTLARQFTRILANFSSLCLKNLNDSFAIFSDMFCNFWAFFNRAEE
jgi:hypothetical protein